MKLPIVFVLNETYQTSTEESVEAGDFADTGFNFEDESYTSEELQAYLQSEGFIHPSSSPLSSKNDYITNERAEDRAYFEKGEETTKSLHLVKIVDADGVELPTEKQNTLWIKVLEGHLNNDLSNSDQELC